ncbi:MAG: DUF3784 domain-containing protein [Bacilli bacterium]
MIVLAIGSIPTFILGIIIWRFKVVEIIAGYDEKKVTDKNGLARWVGLNLMIISIIMIGLYFIFDIYDLENGLSILITILVFIVLLTITALGTRRYENS